MHGLRDSRRLHRSFSDEWKLHCVYTWGNLTTRHVARQRHIGNCSFTWRSPIYRRDLWTFLLWLECQRQCIDKCESFQKRAVQFNKFQVLASDMLWYAACRRSSRLLHCCQISLRRLRWLFSYFLVSLTASESVPLIHCSLVGERVNFAMLQTSLLNYFWQTREESFFAAIRTRIHLAALAIKEKWDNSFSLLFLLDYSMASFLRQGLIFVIARDVAF